MNNKFGALIKKYPHMYPQYRFTYAQKSSETPISLMSESGRDPTKDRLSRFCDGRGSFNEHQQRNNAVYDHGTRTILHLVVIPFQLSGCSLGLDWTEYIISCF